MASLSNIIFLALSAMAMFANMVQGGSLIVKNMCSFPIYCYSSSACGGCQIPSAPPFDEVAAGSSYTGAYPANNDAIGVNVHCGLDSSVSTSNQYQLETAVNVSVSYSDLSAVNGDPFLQYERAINYPGVTDCPDGITGFTCGAGDTSCNWPKSLNCNTEADVYMYICGSY